MDGVESAFLQGCHETRERGRPLHAYDHTEPPRDAGIGGHAVQAEPEETEGRRDVWESGRTVVHVQGDSIGRLSSSEHGNERIEDVTPSDHPDQDAVLS